MRLAPYLFSNPFLAGDTFNARNTLSRTLLIIGNGFCIYDYIALAHVTDSNVPQLGSPAAADDANHYKV